MIQVVYDIIPEKVRLGMDATAIAAAFLSLPIVDVIQGLAAALASFAAFVYTVIRVYYYLKDRRDNNRK